MLTGFKHFPSILALDGHGGYDDLYQRPLVLSLTVSNGTASMIKFPWITGKKKSAESDKAPAPSPTPSPAPEDKPGQETPEHRELVRQALQTRRSKAHVFDNLSREERERLHVIALKTLMPDNK